MVNAMPQSPSPNGSESPTTTASPVENEEAQAIRARGRREAFKIVADDSRTLVGWCLTIIAASVATIVSTSYLRPRSKKVRLAYLLFILGWILCFLSMYYGDRVAGGYRASLFANSDFLFEIGRDINSNFIQQIRFLYVGLSVFFVWLILFLLWWIFSDEAEVRGNNRKGDSK